MSGGGVYVGVGDGQPVARIRPEAVGNAAKHGGAGMSAVMTRVHFRPQTAPAGRTAGNALPGGREVAVNNIPRVKPEAMEIARRASGQMSNILSQSAPKPAIYSYEPPKPRPKTAGPIVHDLTVKNIAIVAPRVKPEAEKIAKSHQGLVGKIFGESYDEARKANIHNSMKIQEIPKPKNHIQANVNRMRQIQKQAREKEKQKKSPVPVKALWRSDKYNSVSSRVSISTWQKQPTPNAPRPNTAPSKSSESKNFVTKNARNAWKPQNKIKRSKSVEDVRRAKNDKEKSQSFYDLEIRGTVPDYLVKRKEELKRIDNEKKKVKDPDCPPNHVRLSEDERRRFLTNLQKSLRESEQELNSLPVRQCDTIKYKMRKSQIENQIAELDEAIRTFSKKKVYVRE